MKNILITGGTGTFGNAFTQRILDNNLVERVAIFSRDEKKQLDMRLRFNDDPRLRFYLGDVRDFSQLKMALQGVDYVVHAAAYKQIDRSATDVLSFVDVNVWGTRNVLMAAHDAGVKKALVLSSDKACDSVSAYGATKNLAEWITANVNVYGPCRSSATRYGNILNSRGSVLELWRDRIACGLRPQVTDERCTRFWMTIEQAVDLVLLALDRMGGGEIFIPKGIERGRVIDLLREHHGDVEYDVTGLRTYEKLHESLISPEEAPRLRDCGDVYVLQPLHVRWEPGPWGTQFPAVPADFQYRSDT